MTIKYIMTELIPMYTDKRVVRFKAQIHPSLIDNQEYQVICADMIFEDGAKMIVTPHNISYTGTILLKSDGLDKRWKE